MSAAVSPSRVSTPDLDQLLANHWRETLARTRLSSAEDQSIIGRVKQKGSNMYPVNSPDTFANRSTDLGQPCPHTARKVARKIIEAERGYHVTLTKTFHQLASASGIPASTWEYWWSQPPGRFVRFQTWRKLCEYHYIWACRRVRLAKQDQLEAIALRGAA